MEVNFGGYESLSTVDYPGRSCITIFLRGCSRRCTWCHNKHLQDGTTLVPVELIYDFIRAASPYVGAIVLSGGEPLEQPEACKAISDFARELGLWVGIHTARRDLLTPEMLYYFDMVLIGDPNRDPR
jgi:pyruvate formate lyase activating enzyme